MNAQFLISFVEAAYDVLRMEIKSHTTRGRLQLQNHSYITEDVTVLISLVGQAEGMVFYSMNEKTARSFASTMLDKEFLVFNDLAQSGIAELSNVITGRATMKLSQKGFHSNISPPTIFVGAGASINYRGVPRIIVPLKSDNGGSLKIHLALREGSAKGLTPSHMDVYSTW